MKSFRNYNLTDRLLPLAPYSLQLGQFGLLLYFISPAVRHIGWLYLLLSVAFMVSLILSVASTYAIFKKDKFQMLNIFIGNQRDRLYEGMIGIAGLIIGFAFKDFAVLLVAGLTLFNGISGFFFKNPMNRR